MTKSVKTTNTELFHVVAGTSHYQHLAADTNYIKKLQFLYYLMNFNAFSVTLILLLELIL